MTTAPILPSPSPIRARPRAASPAGRAVGPICPSGLVLLDLPCLQESHSGDAGYYAAIYSTCPAADSWACAELYRSNDGGGTFGRVARTNDETTVGEIDDITGPPTDVALPGESPQYDESNSITVSLYEGELASITDAQIDAGQNLAAIGSDGAWVIIQFKTATLSTESTYVLTDLIWGLYDTRHLLGTTSAGDTFVLLSDSALLRIPESPDNIGVEKQFKAVTCGESVDAVSPVSFTTWGLCYQRLCPATVLSCSTTSPPTGAVDGDSYYIPNDTSLNGAWETHGGEIATWSDETDSWVYCTPAAGTIVHCSDEDEDVIPPGGGGDPTPAPWQRTIDWQDEGVTVADTGGTIDTVNFVGPGVTATLDSSGALEVNIPGGGGFDTSGDVELALDQLSDVTVPTPTEGDVLVFDGTNGWVNLPLSDVPGGGGSGSLEFVDEYVVSGSAATTMTISSLDLDTDECYYFQGTATNGTGSNADVSLIMNGDTNAANYQRTIFGYAASASGTTSANNALILTGYNLGQSVFVEGWVRVVANSVLTYGQNSRSETGGGSPGGQVFSHDWVSAANVTQLQLTSSVASSFAIGSAFRLWRLTRTGGGGTGGGGSYSPPVTTKGDLFTFDTDDQRLPVGANYDTVVADSAETTGLKWGVPAIPSNSQSGNYTIQATDRGRCIDHVSGAGAGDTYTIPANGTLALEVGFTFTVCNMAADNLTVAITSDTLRKVVTGVAGSVTVPQYCIATFRKVASTTWLWFGVGAV